MARSRNIKPGFFRNEDLVELPFETRLLFIGLWTIADREGRLEDRPKRIRMELFPADNVDVDACLNQLQGAGFILRYTVGESRYIQVVAFGKHQNPHHKESESTIPAPDSASVQSSNVSDSPSVHEDKTRDMPESDPGHAPDTPGTDRADSLNTDSLNTDCGKNGANAPPDPKPKTKRATQVPDDFPITDQIEAWGRDNGFSRRQLESQVPLFQDHYRARGETRKDWVASFRTWMHKARNWNQLPDDRQPEPSGEFLGTEGLKALREQRRRAQEARP